MEFLNVFAEHFVPIIASIFGVVILGLARGLIKKYGAKLDIETKVHLDEMVSNLTQQGVAFAEQWAKNRNRHTPEGVSVGGDEKLHKAMEYIAGQVRKYKLDELAEAELREKIESMLGFGTLNELPLELAAGIEGPEPEDNDEDWKK